MKLPLILLPLIGAVLAGPGAIEPDRPQWGSTPVVTYDPAAEGAKFSAADPVHVVVWLENPDGIRTVWGKMHFGDGVFRYELPVEENLGHVTLYFVTPSDWDPRATVSSMVYRGDGVPARGAHQNEMDSRQWKERFEQEIALYPDNYWAYQTKWNYARGEDEDDLRAMVRKDLEEIDGRVEGRPADYLLARVTGLLLLDREAEARAVLREMAVEFPGSDLLSRAVRSYEYQAFMHGWKGEGPDDVKSLARAAAAAQPAGSLARNKFHELALDEAFSVEHLEAVHDRWVADNPDHPIPYLGLAEGYNLREVKLDRAAKLIDRAIELTLQGNLRFYEDIGGKQIAWYISSAYYAAAKIALAQRRYADSLAYARASQTLKNDTDSRPYLLEGRLWREISDRRRAKEALLKAWNENPESAEAELRDLYAASHGGADGFDDWLRGAGAAIAASPEDEPRSAPSFRVTTLDGGQVDRTGLLGNVVVLNFWFVGCAPCIVEMPSLNELVREFADQPVAFLAMSRDSADDLRTFAEEKEFLYRLVPDAEGIHAAFEVVAYPTHVILDRQGRIRHVLIGGDRETGDRLRPLIQRLLE